MSVWEGLEPPYSTIVADPPWKYEQGGPRNDDPDGVVRPAVKTPPYSMMTVAQIAAMPVIDIAAGDSHLYLWTTNRYLWDSYDIARGWGFKPSQMLTWCKPTKGIGPGGAYSNTTEFVLYCRRGNLPYVNRVSSTWFQAARRAHSQKPEVFFEWVHKVSPGPYVELFARQPRLGWDSWGYGFEAAS